MHGVHVDRVRFPAARPIVLTFIMKRVFFKKKYSPLKGVARVGLSTFVGFVASVAYGFWSISELDTDEQFVEKMSAAMLVGLTVGLGAGALNEWRLYRRPR